MLRSLFALVYVFGVAACPRGTPAPAVRYFKVDTHMHFGPSAVPLVIRYMDQVGIDVAVNLSGGAPGQGLEEQLAAAAEFPGRIYVFTTLDWAKARTGPGYGQLMTRDLVRAKALGARGLKIPKGLGLGYVDWRAELVAVDDLELDVVFETAAELGFPVAIHTGDPVAFWRPATPDNERYAELSAHPGWSFYGQPVQSWEDLFAALERRVARHPKTTFISVHFGNAPEYPERVDALLHKYANLYIDTAARVPEIGRHPAAIMSKFFETHQSRILFGTDFGVGARPGDIMLGSTGAAPPTQAEFDRFFAATWRYFETADKNFASPTPIQGDWTISGIALSPDLLRRVYGENAARLLGIPTP